MINLSLETEALARRLAVAKRLPVEDVIRLALEAFERYVTPIDRGTIEIRDRMGVPIVPEPRKPRDLSPEAIAARKASIDRLVAELAAMPVLDPRPVREIVDDLNTI